MATPYCAVHHIINQAVNPTEAKQFLQLNEAGGDNFPLCPNCKFALNQIVAADLAAQAPGPARRKRRF